MRLWEKYKGWMRNETMLPGVNRGRCFQRTKPDSQPSNDIKITSQPEVTLKIKVTRADGSIEEYNG